jgi:hypothetical protein
MQIFLGVGASTLSGPLGIYVVTAGAIRQIGPDAGASIAFGGNQQ